MINLQKGRGINLSKDHGVNRAIIEVTWDPNPDKTTDRKHQFEVNTVAFELTRKDGGKPIAPQDGCFVFFNNLNSPDGGVQHSPDDWQGGDDKMLVDFTALDKSTLGIDEAMMPSIVVSRSSSVRFSRSSPSISCRRLA